MRVCNYHDCHVETHESYCPDHQSELGNLREELRSCTTIEQLKDWLEANVLEQVWNYPR